MVRKNKQGGWPEQKKETREEGCVYSTLWKFSLYIVYILKMASSFLTKFWQSDQRFRRKTSAPLCLKLLRMRNSRYLLIRTIYKFWSMVLVGNLHWGYPLWLTQWLYSHDFSCKCFLLFNFLLEIPTSTQARKLKFERNKFTKRIVYNLQRKWGDQTNKIDNQHHLSKSIPSVSFNYILFLCL